MNLIIDAVLFLGAAVIAVPLLNRVGLGSVLGYLAAGIVIGPSALGLVGDVESILHFAELGILLLLFLIGLELQPARLWGLRRPIFGMGGAQVIVTGLVLSGIGMLFNLDTGTALVTGFILALSSTAVVIQLLAEKGELRTRTGRVSFSILLFQDMAVIPLLALMPALTLASGLGEVSVEPEAIFFAATAITAVIMTGHFLLPHYLRYVVTSRINELFTISALLVVAGTAALMEFVGLSMALGAFLAGVILSESAYRHALVADIEPFKGLLMGLFFVSVGVYVDLGQVLEQPVTVAGLTLGLLLVKGTCIFLLARLARQPTLVAGRLAFTLPQGGEFAFVLFTAAVANGVVNSEFAGLMILVVSLTMIATPFLHLASQHLFASPPAAAQSDQDFDRIERVDDRVIIAGFGRVGQIVGRVFRTCGVGFTAVDYDFERIRVVRRMGIKIYYGDLTRLWLLRAAGADHAEVLICAIDKVDASIQLVDLARKHFPHLKIYARARDRDHAARCVEHGVDRAVRETLGGSLEIASHALQSLGMASADVRDTIERFRVHDEAMLHAGAHDPDEMHQAMDRSRREEAAELEHLFEEDRADLGTGAPNSP